MPERAALLLAHRRIRLRCCPGSEKKGTRPIWHILTIQAAAGLGLIGPQAKQPSASGGNRQKSEAARLGQRLAGQFLQVLQPVADGVAVAVQRARRDVEAWDQAGDQSPGPAPLAIHLGWGVGTVITVLTVEAALEPPARSFRERSDLNDITPAERDLLIGGAILLAMHIDDLAWESLANLTQAGRQQRDQAPTGRHERYSTAAAA